ncbi:MAG: PAS domain-containing protein [Candidatus Woesearchaeota archaeon]|nr:PAS domain-containing protein [Candidatus Woesearchaeota archaeon]
MVSLETKNRILEFVKNNEMCSSTEIAEKLGINRVTITKYLAILCSERMINFKRIGMAKVWFIEKSPLLGIFGSENYNENLKRMMDLIGEGVIVLNDKGEIVWVNDLIEKINGKLKSIKGRMCYEIFNNGKINENCPAMQTLKNSKVHRSKYHTICSFFKKRSAQITSSPIFDTHKKVVGVIEIVKFEEEVK